MRESLGLGGDGDEIEAVEAVEKAFGVEFDQSDASGWLTVGDVFTSLLLRRNVSNYEGQLLWPKFVAALGEGACLSPEDVE